GGTGQSNAANRLARIKVLACWQLRALSAFLALQYTAPAPDGGSYALSQVRLEPVDGAAHQVPRVLGVVEAVTFTRVDHELSFDAERFECVPEFVALRRRTFAIPLADYDQRWGLYVLDEGDG